MLSLWACETRSDSCGRDQRRRRGRETVTVCTGERTHPGVEILYDFAWLCEWHGDLNVYNGAAKRLRKEVLWKTAIRICFSILVAAKTFHSSFSSNLLWFLSLPRLSQECEAKNTNAVRTYNVTKWRVGGVDLSLYYDLITLWKEVSGATYYKCFPGRWHISEVLVMKVQRWCKYITRSLSLTRTVLQDLTQGPLSDVMFSAAALTRSRHVWQQSEVALKSRPKTDPWGFSSEGGNNYERQPSRKYRLSAKRFAL